jgi:predicted MFS family arabinose efflux permease
MTTSAVASPLSPFSVFRNRNFSLLWVGQVVETIGASLTSLAASILVYRLTGSAASVGLMLMASAAPTILVGLMAGVAVDRYDRKRIMVIADVTRAVLVLLIPFLIPFSMAWLYIIVALSAAVTQFFDPAHEAVLPEIATDEELAAANSLMAISSFGATAIGFAASGLIASSMSIEWAFYLNAFAYAFSALMIWLARIPALTVTAASGLSAIGRNLREGVKVLMGTPILRSLFLVFAIVFVAFGLSNTLLLPFALQALHASEFEYGVQEAVTSVGFVVGSLWMARVSDRLRAQIHPGHAFAVRGSPHRRDRGAGQDRCGLLRHAGHGAAGHLCPPGRHRHPRFDLSGPSGPGFAEGHPPSGRGGER